MSTKLDKDITRETTIQVDNREILVTLSSDQQIRFRLKGLKSGAVSIAIQTLYNQLTNKLSPHPKTEGSVVIDTSEKKNAERSAMISVHDFRSQVLISPDLDLGTKVKLESILVQLIEGIKKNENRKK